MWEGWAPKTRGRTGNIRHRWNIHHRWEDSSKSSSGNGWIEPIYIINIMICCNDIINYKEITLLRIFKTMYKYNEGNCYFICLQEMFYFCWLFFRSFMETLYRFVFNVFSELHSISTYCLMEMHAFRFCNNCILIIN